MRFIIAFTTLVPAHNFIFYPSTFYICTYSNWLVLFWAFRSTIFTFTFLHLLKIIIFIHLYLYL